MTSYRRKRLSPGRRLISDISEMALQVPLAGTTAKIDVTEVAAVRKQIRPRIAWNVLFLKAYAIVALSRPELRQRYIRWPWPHLYEHPNNVAMLTVSREYNGEERLFFGRFNVPEECTLLELQERYDEYREQPVESIKQFRHQIKFSHAPRLLRKFAWFLMREVWTRKAASHMGTFGMSISCFKDVHGNCHVSPMTTTLGVDVVSKNGISETLLTFDHRVLDGQPIIEILQELGRILRGPILDELNEIKSSKMLDRDSVYKSQAA
ncbi:MAG: hypothetical protein KF851_15490 [Pirellulaceae bacterium]|jgi:hypothetical protein|nr:hypothetical protein [Pirellulaceae bacterium]